MGEGDGHGMGWMNEWEGGGHSTHRLLASSRVEQQTPTCGEHCPRQLSLSPSLPFFWRLSGETFVEGRVSLADVSEFVWWPWYTFQVDMYVRKYIHTCCTDLCMDGCT